MSTVLGAYRSSVMKPFPMQIHWHRLKTWLQCSMITITHPFHDACCTPGRDRDLEGGGSMSDEWGGLHEWHCTCMGTYALAAWGMLLAALDSPHRWWMPIFLLGHPQLRPLVEWERWVVEWMEVGQLMSWKVSFAPIIGRLSMHGSACSPTPIL